MKLNPAKVLTLTAILGLQALLMSGCASGFTRGPESKSAALQKISPANPVADLSIELTPAVQEKLKDSLKFDQQALQRTIELALSNQQLFNKDKKGAAPQVHVTVTHVRVRNTFNAVMWGFMSGNDSINGDVELKDATGAVMDRFHIDSSYALGGWAGGQDSMRMNWLYEAFAKQLVAALTGAPTKK